MVIQEIPHGGALYGLTKRLREDVLRLPLGMTLRPHDVEGEERQIHVAAFVEDEVRGTVTLKPLSPTVVKLRQMAVAPEFHGMGIGRDLVRFAEDVARARHFEIIETNARVGARGFYEKLGYRPVGDEFLEVNLPHGRMTKRL